MPDTAQQPKDIRTSDAEQAAGKSPAEGKKSDETVEFVNELIESKDDCGHN